MPGLLVNACIAAVFGVIMDELNRRECIAGNCQKRTIVNIIRQNLLWKILTYVYYNRIREL